MKSLKMLSTFKAQKDHFAYNLNDSPLEKLFSIGRIHLKLLFLLFLLMSCSPEFVTQPRRLVIQSSTVVRKGPGTTYDEVATIQAGTQVFLLESQNDWHRIKLPDGRRGWIYRGVAKTIGREKVVVMKDKARVRRGPGEEYSAFAMILKGKELTCLGERGNWYYVEVVSGKNGWISKRDAEKVSLRNLVTIRDTYAYRDADKRSGIVLNIDSGSELIQLGKVNNFYQIRLPGGKIGYVHESAVTVVRERSVRTKDRTPLRYGPSFGYDVIDTLEAGEQLTKLSEKNNWYEVKTSRGKTGWVPKKVLAITAAASGEEFVEEKPVYVITNRDSNIRHKPGTNQLKITRVKKGTLLLKLDQQGDWIKIKLPDERIGWIYEPLVDYNITIMLTKLKCRIRYGPGTRYQLMKWAYKGMPMVKIGERYGWSRLHFEDGDIGWVKNELLVPLDSLLFAKRDCNVRKGPGIEYQRIDRIKYGTFVYYLGKTKNWFKIRLIPESEKLGRVGFIADTLLSLSGNEFITNERANVRKGPSKDYVILAQLPPKTRLVKIGEKGNWVHVRYRNKETGWIFKELVSYSFNPYPGAIGMQPKIVSLTETNNETTSITSEQFRSNQNDIPVPDDLSTRERGTFPSSEVSGGKERNFWRMSRLSKNDSEYGTKDRTKAVVNLRTQPDTSASIIKTLPVGVLLKKISRSGDWWEVLTEEGTYGWVHGIAFGYAETKYLYAVANANIRYGPSLNYEIIDKARVGDVFKEIEKRGRWYYVEYKGGKRGWIREDMVDKQKVIAPGYDTKFTPELAFGRVMTRVNTKLYDGPSVNYPHKTNLPKNTYLKVIGKYQNWIQVKMEGIGEEGWVPASDVINKFYARIIIVKDAEVHVTPNTKSGIVGRVKRNQTYRPIDQKNAWFRIAINGQTGWVHMDFVAALKYPPVFVNRREINVRRLPDRRSKKIAILKEGARLLPIDDEGEWLFVKMINGDKGWVHKSLVDLQEHPYVIVKSEATVYTKPTSGSIKKGTVRREERYLALDKTEHWYKIPYRTDDVGWVYSGFVKEDIKGTQLITQRAELRMGPGDDYELIDFVKPGTQAKWLKEVGDWQQIEVEEGLVGWVKAFGAKPLQLGKLTATVTNDAYARPSYNSQITGKVIKGKKYEPFEKKGNFYRIQLSSGEYAWAPIDYFESKKTKTVFTLDVAELKSGPNPSAAVLQKLEPATDLIVLGSYGEYYEVEIKETKRRGYVLKALVFE